MIYIICFFLSTFFAIFACKTPNKVVRYVCSAISIVLPAFLAGCRDYAIGTDTQNYVWIYCDSVYRSKNIYEYVFTIHGGREPLFSLLIYCILKLFNNVNILFFIEELIIVTCIYIGIYRHKDNCNMPLALLVFYFLHYNATYNITRQYLAMAILFLGVEKIEKKQYVKYCAYIFVASLFHSSAIIAICVLGVRFFLIEHKCKVMLNTLFILVAGILLTSLVPIINMLIGLGIIDSRFLGYLGVDNPVTANFLSLILIVVFIFLSVRSYIGNKVTTNVAFYKKCMMVELVMLWATRKIYFGNRIANYFAMTDCLLVSSIPSYVRTRKQRIIVWIGLAALFLFYWYYVSVRGNSGETYPYRSAILGIE